MSEFIARLSRNISAEESARIQEQKNVLQELLQKTEGLSLEQWEEGLARLAPYRLRASSTLKKGELETWQKANLFISEKIQNAEAPSWEHLLSINALLLGESTGRIRGEKIFIGPIEACPPEELSEALEYFKKNILNPETHSDVFHMAALAQYWLVSLHPFANGNGRTAVLLADWILNSHGLLPMSFETKLDAIIATLSDGRAHATPANAVLKLLQNVQRSYRLVLGL